MDKQTTYYRPDDQPDTFTPCEARALVDVLERLTAGGGELAIQLRDLAVFPEAKMQATRVSSILRYLKAEGVVTTRYVRAANKTRLTAYRVDWTAFAHWSARNLDRICRDHQQGGCK